MWYILGMCGVCILHVGSYVGVYMCIFDVCSVCTCVWWCLVVRAGTEAVSLLAGSAFLEGAPAPAAMAEGQLWVSCTTGKAHGVASYCFLSSCMMW